MQRLRVQLGIIRWLILGVVTFVVVISSVSVAFGQLPSLPNITSPKLAEPPTEVERYGNIEVAWVRSHIDNKELFQIASATVYDRDKDSKSAGVEVRAAQVTANLRRVFDRYYNPVFDKTQDPNKLVVAIGTLNKIPVIQVSDAQGSRPIRLVSITDNDADFHGQTVEALAQEWRGILNQEIVRQFETYLPKNVGKGLWKAIQILFWLVVITAIVWKLRQILANRQQALKVQQESVVAQAQIEPESQETEDLSAKQTRFVEAFQHRFSQERRISTYKFLQWLLFWMLILSWYAGVATITSDVVGLSQYSGNVLGIPIALLLIWFFTGLAIRISHALINRLTDAWQTHQFLALDPQRAVLRTSTVASALKGLATFLIIVTGLLTALNLLGISTGSVIAGGAIIGLAVSFGSQNLVKDLVNGCLILIEDQFAVGDVIQVNNKGGMVENLNLRITQLRDAEGSLITIPNSSISEVKNLSRLWSRVDFSIEIAYESDLKQALTLLDAIAQQMYSEPEWRERMPNPPQVLGVDHLSHEGMLLRVWIKTAPLQQWAVGREFRYRVRMAFEDHQIQIGKPQVVNHVGSLAEEEPISQSDRPLP